MNGLFLSRRVSLKSISHAIYMHYIHTHTETNFVAQTLFDLDFLLFMLVVVPFNAH